MVNIRPPGGNQQGQKQPVGQQRVLINQQLVRPQNNTVRLAHLSPKKVFIFNHIDFGYL